MIIELKNVSKTYKGCKNPAVKDVSFQIQRGKLLTLLGPSGCGKTTILRLIAGLERPDSGEIIVRGKTVAAKNSWVPPEKRGIGMVFQDYALFPHLSVEKNIGFALKKNKNENKTRLHFMGTK